MKAFNLLASVALAGATAQACIRINVDETFGDDGTGHASVQIFDNNDFWKAFDADVSGFSFTSNVGADDGSEYVVSISADVNSEFFRRATGSVSHGDNYKDKPLELVDAVDDSNDNGQHRRMYCLWDNFDDCTDDQGNEIYKCRV